MTRTSRPSIQPTSTLLVHGKAGLVTLQGEMDEALTGFGAISELDALVIDVSKVSRVTSAGVRQWMTTLAELPKSIRDVYLLGCPLFFVDQLNMVSKFGGPSKVLTVTAPFRCSACSREFHKTVDVLANHATITDSTFGHVCDGCGQRLELDETPETYFGFVTRYGATSVVPSAAQLLAAHGLYTSRSIAHRPVRAIKLVQGTVTYLRLIGVIGSAFRARAFLVGIDGAVVLDLAEIERFEKSGYQEWKRLVGQLADKASSITLVDITPSFLENAHESLAISRKVVVASILLPYHCGDCGRVADESTDLAEAAWPIELPERVCATCGGTTRPDVTFELLAPLQKASTVVPSESVRVVARREEIVSRAMADASVASVAPTVTDENTVLGKYNIVRRLSAGGMAEVFLATQIGLGGFQKPVAIKRIQQKMLESRRHAVELFLNEAKIAGRLLHPNIVQVLDIGDSGGALYLVMEYVHGKDLRVILKALARQRQRFPLAEGLYLVREIAQALHFAYWSTGMDGKQLSVVHRDISPHNVIVGYDGSVKLLDFGVASSAITEEATLIVGKWMYMAPEATVDARTDHRSDLFSLGVILYLLCSGRMPFSGKDEKSIVAAIQAATYTSLDELAPDLPPKLTDLVHRLLEADPARRPKTGQEVVAAVNEIITECGLASSAAKMAHLLEEVIPSKDMPLPDDVVLELVRDNSPGAVSPVTGARAHTNSFSLSPSRRTTARSVSTVTSSLDPLTQASEPPFTEVRPTELPATEGTATGALIEITPAEPERRPRSGLRLLLIAGALAIVLAIVLAIATDYVAIR